VAEQGQQIKASVAQILDFAGIKLDDINPNVKASEQAPFQKTTYRHTGVEIVFDMEYVNFDHAQHGASSSFATDEVYCVITVKKSPSAWSGLGTRVERYPDGYVTTDGTVAYRSTLDDNEPYPRRNVHIVNRHMQSVRILFTQRGRIGEFSFYIMVNTLIQGIVILGVVTAITSFFASYIMGSLCGDPVSSKVYKGHIQKYVNVRMKSPYCELPEESVQGQVLPRAAVDFAIAASNFIENYAVKTEVEETDEFGVSTGVRKVSLNILDKSKLYGTLRACIDNDAMGDDQVAAMVWWICDQAQKSRSLLAKKKRGRRRR